jgi:hypothetical protein
VTSLSSSIVASEKFPAVSSSDFRSDPEGQSEDSGTALSVFLESTACRLFPATQLRLWGLVCSECRNTGDFEWVAMSKWQPTMTSEMNETVPHTLQMPSWKKQVSGIFP